MGHESDLPYYAPRPGYNPNLTKTISDTSLNDLLPSATPKTNDSPLEYKPVSSSSAKTEIVYIPVQTPELRQKSQRLICPNCHKQIKTKVTYKSSGSAWASCCLLACMGCCLCCLLPFCLDSFQDIEHSCPNCKAYIGKYRK